VRSQTALVPFLDRFRRGTLPRREAYNGLCDEEHEHNVKNGTPDAEAKQPAPLPVFEHVDAGIYRYIPNGNYYEQSAVNGRRTWRWLKTKNLKFARERLHQRVPG